jgi:hypothetical protein
MYPSGGLTIRWHGRRKEEGVMRKFLLASVATLGTGGLMGAAFAQAPAGPVGGPTQGQVAWPLANPLASANTNNNYQAPALPGPLANPTPGTIVIHIAGKVQTTFQSSWSNLDQRTFVTPAGSTGGAPLTITAAGPGGGIVGATLGTPPKPPFLPPFSATTAPAPPTASKVLDIRRKCAILVAASD